MTAPLLLAGIGIWQIRFGEVVPSGRGMGWDGRTYVWVANELPTILASGTLDAYHLKRILPSTVVWLVLRVLDLPLDPGHAREVFAWLNLGMQLVTLAAWTGAARRVGVREGALWLGFVLLFFNFANLKMPFYYSPLTDPSAQALGAALLYFHLAGRPVGVLSLLFLGAFTWPSLLAFGSVLFVYPRGEAGPGDATLPSWWGRTAGAMACAAFGGLQIVYRKDVVAVGGGVVSLLVALAYLYPVTRDLMSDASLAPAALVRRLSLPRLAVVAALGAGVGLATRAISSPVSIGTDYLLGNLAIFSVARPGIFLVAHGAYFGLIIPALIVFWKCSAAAAHRLGTGFTLFLLLHMALALFSESRILIDGLPAFVLVAVMAASTLRWPAFTVFATALLGLATSKVWLHLSGPGFVRKDPATFPAQYYFMNFGPWMSTGSYLAQGAVLVAFTGLLWVVKKRLPPSEPAMAFAALEVPRILVRAAAVALALVLSLGGVEAAFRLYVRHQRSRSIRSPVESGATLGSEVRLADHGRRVPGVRRLLLVGLSSPLRPDFRTECQHSLSTNGLRYEVLSVGGDNRGTSASAKFYLCQGRAYDPDVVVLVFHPADLAEEDAVPEGEGCPPSQEGRAAPPPSRDLLYRLDTRPWRGSTALRLIGNWAAMDHPTVHEWMLRGGLAMRADPPRALWAYGPIREVRPWWSRAETALGELKTAVQPQARLVVLFAPEEYEVQEESWDRLLRIYSIGRQRWTQGRIGDRLAAVCRDLDIPLVDPRGALAEAGPSAPIYSREDGAWTEHGNALVAKILAQALNASPPPPAEAP